MCSKMAPIKPENQWKGEVDMRITKKLLEVRAKRLEPDDVKLLNIVDMALGFSAMMRLFQEGSKEII